MTAGTSVPERPVEIQETRRRHASTETWYGRLVAARYDSFMARTERRTLRRHRIALLRGAVGRVLEIGGGTGANLPFFGNGIEELVITEPERPMVRKLERRLDASRLTARVVPAPAEDLPFADRSFDVVVSTLVLCTVTELDGSLREIKRVLASNGRLLFLEHVRSDSPRLARWQDRLEGIWMRLGHGCHCNRRTLEALTDAGFSIADLTRDQMRGMPPIVHPLVIGSAVAAT